MNGMQSFDSTTDGMTTNASARQQTEAREASEAPLLVIGAGGQWFSVGDFRVDLSRRKPVARLLWALAEGAEVDMVRGMLTAELIALTWPGERLVKNAGRIRLRVAVATLRTMGMAGRLVTTATGYTLGGPIRLERADAEESGVVSQVQLAQESAPASSRTDTTDTTRTDRVSMVVPASGVGTGAGVAAGASAGVEDDSVPCSTGVPSGITFTSRTDGESESDFERQRVAS